MLDRYGNLRRNIDPSEIKRVLGGMKTYDTLTTYRNSPRDAGDVYKDKYFIDITDEGGTPTGIRVFYPKENVKDKRILMQMPGEG